MHFKAINRGLTITHFGRWTIFVILIISTLAVLTGNNALFLFLAASFGTFTVSGLVSEKNIQHCQIESSFRTQIINQSLPEHFKLTVVNRSKRASLVAIELKLCITQPFFGLIRSTLAPFATAALTHLKPNRSLELNLTGNIGNRGHYQKLYCLERTSFPFGLFWKFKISRIDTKVLVIPPVRQELEQQWLAITYQLQNRLQKADGFVGHHNATIDTPSRLLDWKKNAGKAPMNWVAKKFESSAHPQTILLETLPQAFSEMSPQSYERLLANFRTGVEILWKQGFKVGLRIGNHSSQLSQDSIYQLLAEVNQQDSSTACQRKINFATVIHVSEDKAYVST